MTPALAPHAIYTVSEPSLRGIAEISAERDVPVTSTSPRPRTRSPGASTRPGIRPAYYLDRRDAGSADPARTLRLARPSEIELIAERGATMVTNPVANLKLAVGGVFPYSARGRREPRWRWAPTVPAPTTRSICSTT